MLWTVIRLCKIKYCAAFICSVNSLLFCKHAVCTHGCTHALLVLGSDTPHFVSLLWYTLRIVSCSNCSHHTAGGSSERSITFKRVAHLPSPVSAVDDKTSLQEKRRLLKQQEDQQRNSLEQMLQLHLETSSPSPVQATGASGKVACLHTADSSVHNIMATAT